jgi:hypothetical protein
MDHILRKIERLMSLCGSAQQSLLQTGHVKTAGIGLVLRPFKSLVIGSIFSLRSVFRTFYP